MVKAISTNLLFLTKFGQQKHKRIQISYTEIVENTVEILAKRIHYNLVCWNS